MDWTPLMFFFFSHVCCPAGLRSYVGQYMCVVLTTYLYVCVIVVMCLGSQLW